MKVCQLFPPNLNLFVVLSPALSPVRVAGLQRRHHLNNKPLTCALRCSWPRCCYAHERKPVALARAQTTRTECAMMVVLEQSILSVNLEAIAPTVDPERERRHRSAGWILQSL